MFDEREALVAAIAANPDDDTLRLAFADWLQEHGEDDRAEFIRLECELARRCAELGSTWPWPDGYREMWEVSHDLFELRQSFWFEDFHRALGADETMSYYPPHGWGKRLWTRIAGEPRYTHHYLETFCGGNASLEIRGNGPVWELGVNRGFADHVKLNFRSRFAVPDFAAAFRLEPVHRLSIPFSPNDLLWRSIDLPCLSRVSRLNLELPNTQGRKEVAAFERLARSDNWSGVRDLSCWSRHSAGLICPAVYVEHVANSPLISRVTQLLICTDLDGFQRLATSPHATSLQNLNIWGCNLPPEAVDVLREAVFRPNLQSLNASLNHLGDDGARRFAAGGAWPSLRSLELGCNDISDVGVQELLPLIPQLNHLSLCSGSITDAGAIAIAEAIDPAKLESLWLSYNPLSPEVVGRLRERFGTRFHFTTREEDEQQRRLSG